MTVTTITDTILSTRYTPSVLQEATHAQPFYTQLSCDVAIQSAI